MKNISSIRNQTLLASVPPSGNSVFLVNDDERGLHQDHGKWLEGLAPHATTSQYLHDRTGEACPERNEGTTPMPK